MTDRNTPIIRIAPLLRSVCISLTLLAASGQAHGAIEDLIDKAKLTSENTAEISSWMRRQYGQFLGAKNPKEIKNAAQEFTDLIRKSKVKPSDAFLAEYARKCSESLSDAASDENVEKAVWAIVVLVDLDRPETATGLADALKSQHPSVRVKAAIGIHRLHKRLKDKAVIASVLTRLGEAGAAETHSLCLREIYKAIDFPSSVPDFKYGNELAGALAKLFAGRVERLNSGGHDEAMDLPGLAAAAAVASKADGLNRGPLAESLNGLMAHSVERAVDKQVNDATRTTLIKVAGACETALGKLITAGGASAPTDKVSDALKTKNEKKARDALAKWSTAAKAIK